MQQSKIAGAIFFPGLFKYEISGKKSGLTPFNATEPQFEIFKYYFIVYLKLVI